MQKLEEKLFKKNEDRLKKLNLPEYKPKMKVLFLDELAPASIDILKIPLIYNAKRGIHGNMAAQVACMVNPNIEPCGAKFNGTCGLEKVINYCIQEGIRIISASINFQYFSKREELLKKYADWGGIFVTSAGNYENRRVRYPGCSLYTVCVSATNDSDCNGCEINVTADSYWYVRNTKKDRYHSFSGTSCSAPVIAGCITYILDMYPNFKLDDVKEFLKDSSIAGVYSLEPYERFFSFSNTFGHDRVKIEMTIGSKQAYVNDKPVQIDVEPQIYNERTLVPVRFISEALGCNVEWDDEKRKITITKP